MAYTDADLDSVAPPIQSSASPASKGSFTDADLDAAPVAKPQQSDSQYWHSVGADDPDKNFPNVKEEGSLLPIKTTYNPDGTVDSSRMDWSAPGRHLATGIGDLYQSAENKSTNETPAGINAMATMAMAPGALRGVGNLADASLEARAASLPPEAPPSVAPSPKIRNYDQIKTANSALSDNTSAHYQNAETLGATLTPEASQLAKETLQQEVGNDLDQGLHPQTIGALNLFNKKAAQGLDWQSIDNTRKKLNMIAYDSNANANDVGAAKQAIRSIDNILDGVQENPDMLAKGTPDAIDALRAARQASSTEQSHSAIAAILRKANGNPNAIQSGFKSLYDDEGAFNRFSDDNQDLIKGIAHPGKLVSNLQTIGKMGPGGNGTINLAEAAGILSGNPIAMGLAGTGAVTGAGANMIRSSLIRNNAERILKNIEAESKPVSSVGTPFLDAEQEAAEARANQPPPRSLPAPSINLPANQSGLYKQIPSTVDTTRPEFPLVQDKATGETRHMTQDEAHDYIQAGQHSSNDLPRGLKMAQSQRANSIEADRLKRAQQAYQQNPSNASDLGRQVGNAPIGIGPERQAIRDRDAALLDNKDWGTIENYATQERHPEDVGEVGQALLRSIRGFRRGGAVQPTEAQKHAGNYSKPKINFQSLPISIETPKGEIRSGKNKDGKEWKIRMPVPYGYIRKTESADGEHIDCFLGPNKHSLRVYVIDQKKDDGSYDEAKCMLGFPDRESALKAYRDSFSDKKNRIMKVTKMLMPQFKEWLKNGDTKKPMGKAA